LAELTVSTLILLFVFIATTPLLYRVPRCPGKLPGPGMPAGSPPILRAFAAAPGRLVYR
jgi:hypothetical protein